MTPTVSEHQGVPAGKIAAAGAVDLDVHHGTQDLVGALSPHLSKVYRQRIADYGFPLGHGPFADDGGVRGWRADLLGGEVPARQFPGGAAAWDREATRRALFETGNLALAVLTGGAMNGVQSMPDVDYASALCRAFNDWTRETWLADDERYLHAMAICTQDVPGAVAEIDRIGDDPRVCGVLMPTGSARPFGQRMFEPIFEALERHRLPILLHRGADGDGIFGQLTTGAGTPTHLAEAVVAQPASGEVHLESLIFEAVFDRHPDLRVVLLGMGFGWLPSYLWRMDLDWKGLRWHTPWVKKLPSEYVREHVRVGTGPWSQVPAGPFRDHVWEWIGAEESLVFASGYPQWDADKVEDVRTGLPEALRGRVLRENALEVLRR